MKIYNEEKTLELKSYDLNRGFLKPDVLITHIYAVKGEKEEGHYETIREYKNGGKDVKWVIDKPGVESVEAHDEKEPIMIYIPYTEQELKIKEDKMLIEKNKQFLQETDYIISKLSERRLLGLDISGELKEYGETIKKREEARKVINQLEQELKTLNTNIPSKR